MASKPRTLKIPDDCKHDLAKAKAWMMQTMLPIHQEVVDNMRAKYGFNGRVEQRGEFAHRNHLGRWCS